MAKLSGRPHFGTPNGIKRGLNGCGSRGFTMQGTIPKPSRRVHRDCDVRQSMRADHRDVFDLFEAHVNQQIDDGLDCTKTAAQQDPQKITDIETTTLERFPELSCYDDHWPLKSLIALRLSERRSYYNHQRRERRPSRRSSTLSSSSRSSSLRSSTLSSSSRSSSLRPGSPTQHSSCMASPASLSTCSLSSVDEIFIPRCDSPMDRASPYLQENTMDHAGIHPTRMSPSAILSNLDGTSCARPSDYMRREPHMPYAPHYGARSVDTEGLQRTTSGFAPEMLWSHAIVAGSTDCSSAYMGPCFPDPCLRRISPQPVSQHAYSEPPARFYSHSAAASSLDFGASDEMDIDFEPATRPVPLIDDYSWYLGPSKTPPPSPRNHGPGGYRETSPAVADQEVRVRHTHQPLRMAGQDPDMFHIPRMPLYDAWTGSGVHLGPPVVGL